MNVYHLLPNLKSVKQYGLMSSHTMYHTHPKLFHDVTFPNYKERVVKDFGKKNINDDDVLMWLDTKRKPITSRSVWFSFLPSHEMPHIRVSGWEVEIPIHIVKKYSIASPVIIRRRNYDQISWKDFLNNFQNFYDEAKKQAKKEPKNNLKYMYMVHFAVECETIPFKELIVLPRNNDDRVEKFNQMIQKHFIH